MTRKHFEAIAKTIKESNINDFAKTVIAYDMARTCNRFNDNFDQEKFLEACGVDWR